MRALLADVDRLKPAPVAVPALGCGLGGLAWADVKPLIERALGAHLHVRVQVIAPAETVAQ